MNEQNQGFEEITRVVEPTATKMSPVQRLISLIISPVELMQNIKLFPVILVPYLAAIVFGLLSIPLMGQFSDMTMQELSRISLDLHGVDLSGWTEMQSADVYGDADSTTGMDIVSTVTTVVSIFVLPFLMSLIGAVLYIILSKIFRGAATFKQLFSMYMHVYVIIAIGALAVVSLSVATNSVTDLTSLAAVVMPNGNMSMPLFNVLSYINIFNVWTYIVLFIGIKTLNGFSGSIKAIIITLISFVVSVSVTVGFSMLIFIGWNFMMGAM